MSAEQDLSFDGPIPDPIPEKTRPAGSGRDRGAFTTQPPRPLAGEYIPDPPPAEPEAHRTERHDPRSPTTAPASLPAGGREEYRGIGDVYLRQPIAAVVEIMRRDESGQRHRPFTKGCRGLPVFTIMTPRTTLVLDGRERRDFHPQFKAFNEDKSDRCRSLNCIVVHWQEHDAWKFNLQAYAAPQKNQSPPSGCWCRGDATNATRWNAAKRTFDKIRCPGRLCEFQQPTFGPRNDSVWCKPRLTLIAQMVWNSPGMPNMIFQWESTSWNAYSSCEGMFRLIRDTAERLGIKDCPVFGLPFTMTVSETHKKGRAYPEVSFSLVGSPMEWLSKINQLQQNAKQLEMSAPAPLQLMPPPGATPQDMERASEAALSEHYRPANERAE